MIAQVLAKNKARGRERPLCQEKQGGAAGDGSPFTGVALEKFSKISGAQNLSDSLNSFRATGPWVRKNFRWCVSTAAPAFAEQAAAGAGL